MVRFGSTTDDLHPPSGKVYSYKILLLTYILPQQTYFVCITKKLHNMLQLRDTN